MSLELLMPRFLSELYEDTQYLLSCQLSFACALSTKANVIHIYTEGCNGLAGVD